MNYLKNNLKTYINSFKNKSILLITTLNAAFILVTVALIKLTQIISKPWIDKIQKVSLENIALKTEAQLETIASALRGFALFAIITAIALILLIIVNWSFFQGMIYHILLKKKFNLKYFGKFLLLNLVWFLPWLILFFIILFGSKTNYLVASFYAIIIIFLHSSFVLYTLFVKDKKLKKLLHLKISIGRIHHFVIPYTLVTITFLIISQLNLLNLHSMLITLIYILFFSWLQNYTKDITLTLKD